MAVEWSMATPEILELARRIIAEHHPDLREARIAFVRRHGPSRSENKIILGKAKRLTAEMQLHIPYDFIIWVSAGWWLSLTATQREALIDHELSHCKWDIDERQASIAHHDIEEFAHIIERYGFWQPFGDSVEAAAEKAVQATLPLATSPDEPKREGSVGTIDMSKAMEGALEAE